jgi:hypothetical protein
MELELINKLRHQLNNLYLELSPLVTVKTLRELELEDLLASAHNISARRGVDTDWQLFSQQLTKAGISSVTPKTFENIPRLSDLEQERLNFEKWWIYYSEGSLEKDGGEKYVVRETRLAWEAWLVRSNCMEPVE